MIRFFLRHKTTTQCLAALALVSFLNQVILPHTLMAQAQGPGQAEHQAFSPSASSEMVNLFTGDFSYSIPLMEVDGYPLVLGYNGDVKMEQEASWVGLGWSLNPGALNRGVRGLPDDFLNDTVLEEQHMKPLTDAARENGVEAEASIPITSLIDKIINTLTATEIPIVEQVFSLNLGLNAKAAVNMGENSYTQSYIDLVFESGYNTALSLNPQGYGGYSPGWLRGNGLGVSLSSRSGIGVNPSSTQGNISTFGYPGVASYTTTSSKNISANYSTRSGLDQIAVTQSNSQSVSAGYGPVSGTLSTSSSQSSFLFPGTSTYTPYSAYSTTTLGNNLLNKEGIMDPIGLFRVYGLDNKTASATINLDSTLSNHAIGYLYHHEASYEKKKDQLMDFNRGMNSLHVPKTMTQLSYAFQTHDIYTATGSGMNLQFRPHRNDIGFVFDPFKTNIGNSQTFVRRVAKNPTGSLISGTVGKAISKVANAIVDVPPFIDEFILKGGITVPFEFENGHGNGLSVSAFGGWFAPGGHLGQNTLAFKAPGDVDARDYEPVYFKSVGDITLAENDIASAFGHFSPVRPGIIVNPNEASPEETTLTLNTTDFSMVQEDRVPRNNHISMLTADEAAVHALEKKIYSYGAFDANGDFTVSDSMMRNTGIRKAHHLSEFTVLQPGGSRYVYGTPVYNNVQKQVVFSVDAYQLDSCSMTVVYNAGTDNTPNNSKGKSHYFKSVETPAYASAFLLDAIISPDYVDITGNGPSDDDLGNYTRFRYTRTSSAYKWRIPYSDNSLTPRASYAEGYRNFDHDDIATYTYGEKELWYAHSIEGKTQVAEFYLSNRVDGYGVSSENGVINTGVPLKKLSKIVLYDKKERETLGADAEPLKTVHFEYDYALCEGIPANSGGSDPDGYTNQGGKLTLTKVWFTHGKSEKGRLSPYRFTYTNNYDYTPGAYDRWGNYQPHQCSELSNMEYPYSEQDTSLANEYARAWKLSRVDLPSGASMNVYYEADNYAHVQHLDAAKMFAIKGFGNTTAFQASAQLYVKSSGRYTYNRYVYFELDEPVAVGASQDYVSEHYLKGLEYLYFKVLGRTLAGSGYQDEYYNGYAEIEDAGFCDPPGSDYTHGWIKLKPVTIVDQNENVPGLPPFVEALLPGSDNHELTNAIAKTGWQHLRLNLKEVLYPELNCSSSQSGSALGQLLDLDVLPQHIVDQIAIFDGYVPGVSQFLGLQSASSFTGIGVKDAIAIYNCLKQYFQSSFGLDWAALTQGGINVALRDIGAADRVQLGKSFIKLSCPYKHKTGGGYRVSRITSTDGWGNMGGDADMTYGQVYDYTLVDEEGDVVTSGVASYEPQIGNDENPWKKPVFYDVENILYPDDHHYQDEPVGEELFPGAYVGYSRVRVNNLERTLVTRTATGHKVYEFYTAKDFPVVIKKTDIKPAVFEVKPTPEHNSTKPNREVDDLTVDVYGGTQGYLVRLNDMHGKPRSRSIYNSDNVLKNSVTFHYSQQKGETPGTFVLDNEVRTYGSQGSLATKPMGRDYDITVDTRHSVNFSESRFSSRNYNISLNFGFGKASHSQIISKVFGSGVVFRAVSEYGILLRTEVKDGSSTIEQKNQAFDRLSGNPVLVSVQNDFDKAIYDFSLPAHWIYPGMTPAYHNQGVELKEATALEVVDNTGKIETAYKSYFHPGDEVMATNVNTGQIDAKRYWVVKNKAGHYKVVDKDGVIPVFLGSAPYAYKVLRSGRRNQQFESAGSINSPYSVFSVDSALMASATEFTDEWQMYCGIDSVYAGAPLNEPDLNDWVAFVNELIANGQFSGSSSHDLIPYSGYNNLFAGFVSNPSSCDPFLIQVQTNSTNKNLFLICTSTLSTYGFGSFSNTGFPGGQTFDSIAYLSNPVFISTMGGQTDFDVWVHFHNGETSVVNIDECYFEAESATCSGELGFCGLHPGDVVNPYYRGVRGNYRPYRNYVYYDKARDVGDNPNLREDGVFTYERFWKTVSGTWRPITDPQHPDHGTHGDKWLKVQEITKCDPFGNMLESKDALGLYSATLTGYNHTKTVATAANARYRQVAFDGFEDYGYYEGSCNSGHLNFFDQREKLSDQHAHTGRYAMRLEAGDSVYATRSLTERYPVDAKTDVPFKLRNNECLGTFAPYTNNGKAEKYVLSYWVKVGNNPGTLTDYSQVDVTLEVDCSVLSPLSTDLSNIIDGWQRVEKIYQLPGGALQYITVKMRNDRVSGTAYFDDLRIHPFRAAMQAMIYDPLSLRLVASLDDRNFATFYDYDRQGRLVVCKKETERGIFTLTESRSAIAKD